METIVILGILLLGSVGYLGHKIEMLRQSMLTPEHLEKTKRSISNSVNSKINKKLSTPVEVDCFIEAVVNAFQRGEDIEAHSNMEIEIIKYIARESFQYEPQAHINYTPDGRDFRYRSTTLTYKES